MTCLPSHGKINCTKCYSQRSVKFDQTIEKEGF